MARLRREEPRRPTDLPPELRVCWIEDWDDAASPPHYVDADDPEDVWLWKAVRAWSAWQDARRQWCEANGVDFYQLPSKGPASRTYCEERGIVLDG